MGPYTSVKRIQDLTPRNRYLNCYKGPNISAVTLCRPLRAIQLILEVVRILTSCLVSRSENPDPLLQIKTYQIGRGVSRQFFFTISSQTVSVNYSFFF
ncbi:hypothetical protein B9Z55_022490 [Caenorhabditis nigoni]|nr:hypothetical protein B9Z55_022490 [Caenorhabditis nigoni]